MTGEIRLNNSFNGLGGTQSAFSNYTSQVGLLDAGLGLDADVMGSSIFSGSYSGFGMGNGAETRNMTQSQYLQYMTELQGQQLKSQQWLENIQLDNQVKQKHALEVANFKANAPEDEITRQSGILQRQIKNNEQENVTVEYRNLEVAVRAKFEEAGYTNVPKNQIKAYSEKLYHEATGENLVDSLEKHGDSEFVQGLKEGAFALGFITNNMTSAKDNISNITGEKKSVNDNILRNTGRVLAGVTTLIAIPFLLKGGIKALKGSFNLFVAGCRNLFKKSGSVAADATGAMAIGARA